MRTRSVAAAVAVLCVTSLAQAALVIHEPFDGYNTGVSLGGQLPNSNTIGLNQATAYAASSSTMFKPQAAGLTFGDLATSGGALQVWSTANANPQYVGAKLSSSAVTGDLFVSYLVNIESFSTTYNGLGINLTDSAAGAGNSVARLGVYADAQDATVQRPGIGYSGTTSTTVSAASSALTTNATYLVLAKFTNIGSILTSGTPGVATLWALSLDQYNNIKSGGISESELTAGNVTATATKSVTSGTYNFDSTKFLNIALFGVVTPPEKGLMDEIRYGTTLADVTPAVPEPATLALLLGSLALGAMRRRG